MSVHPELVEGQVVARQGFDKLSPNAEKALIEFVNHCFRTQPLVAHPITPPRK